MSPAPVPDPTWPRRAWDLGLLHTGGDPHHCPACLGKPEPPVGMVCPGDNTEVLANPQPAAADTSEEAATETECANCWRLIENRGDPNMGGPTRDHWVHVPGGFTACFPQRGADSPRAEPRTEEEPRP